MSADENARSDSVRMLPSALRLKLSAVAESSSGASTTVTMSYRPCVQNISFTVTPNVFAICLKASARFGKFFRIFDALIGKRGKHDIGHHGRSPWLLVYLILPPGPTEGSLEDFMPKLDGILETAIHTEDMVRARAFYEDVLGLEPIYSDNRLSAYAVAGRDVLLVFRKGTTRQTVVLPSGTIPGHGGDGVLHVAFAIGKDELDRWEAHLDSRGVAIEGRNDWERGGRSIYFRDPDGHLLELATPGLWSIY